MKKQIILLFFVIFSLCLPCVKGDNTNLVPLSSFYDSGTYALHMPYAGNYAELVNVSKDGETVLAIHIKPNSGVYTGEVNSRRIWVSPNDNVIVRCWVKTGEFESTDLQGGAFFGFDFDGTNGAYGGILGTGTSTNDQIGHPSGNEKGYGNPDNFGYTINGERGLSQQSGLTCKIPFGTDWTLLQYSLVVPSGTYNYIWVNNQPVYVSDTHINSMIFWTGVNDDGEAWFTEPEVLVNPIVESITPQPTIINNNPTIQPTNNNLIGDLDLDESDYIAYSIIGIIFAGIILYCVALLVGKVK